MRRIYVAGPMSAATEKEVEANVLVAMMVGAHLMDAGHIVFIPHLNFYLQRHTHKRTYSAWSNHDFAWLRTCDTLALIAPSNGACQEANVAFTAGLAVKRVQKSAEGRYYLGRSIHTYEDCLPRCPHCKIADCNWCECCCKPAFACCQPGGGVSDQEGTYLCKACIVKGD